MPHQWDFRLLNRLPALAEFNGKLGACLTAAHPPEGTAFAIGLILDEWLTNIIKYGHSGEDAAHARDGDDTPFRLIDVRLVLDDEGFEITVRDDGMPFDPTVAPQRPDETHLPVEERKVGGWGLDLVRRTADQMAYRREGDRNIVTLRKRHATPGAGPAPASGHPRPSESRTQRVKGRTRDFPPKLPAPLTPALQLSPSHFATMQIERISVPGAEVLAIQGQLDATTATQLEGALEDAADYGGGQPLIVDLAGVGLISSAALRVLLSAAKRARKESGKIHLCAANAEVRKVFEISGLAALFDLHDTRENALAATGASTAAEPLAEFPASSSTALPVAPAAFPTPEIPPAAPAPEEPAPPFAAAPPQPPPEPGFGPDSVTFVPPPAVAAPAVPPPVETEFIVPPPAPPVPDFESAPTVASLPVPPLPAFVPPPEPPPAPTTAPPPLAPVVAPEPFVPPLPVVTVSAAPPPVPPPARPKSVGAPPPPAPARVPAKVAPATAPGAAKRPFPLFPILAGVLALGLVAAAAAWFLFNRFAPKTGLAEGTPAPNASPATTPTPSPEPSIVSLDSPTPEPSSAPSAAPTMAAESSPTPTPTPAVVSGSNGTPAPAANGTGAAGDANRIAAPSQINFDPADPRNAAVKDAVLSRIESMPVARKIKDQLFAALDRARGMGKVATITFGTGRTDLSPADVETLRKGLAQPLTARLTADPTVVIVVLGYADTKGDAAANRKLSEQRAARTIEALKGPCGLMNIMHSVGMGASQLLDGKNAEANRAVEVWAVQP